MSQQESSVRLFNSWSFDDVEVRDWTLERYINLKPVILPHSCGRHEKKTFWKSQKVSIIERFINRLLSPGFIGTKIKGKKSSYNQGKKNHVIKAVKNAFILINLRTDQNPIQVLVDAICNTAPREEVTKIAMGGISYSSAVDIAPQRRVDLAIKYLVQAIGTSSHSNIKSFEENIAKELVLTGQNSQESRAIRKKDEVERIALSAR
ncbi:MAG: 30S ribosomal protein S7 [Candidatus Lokiarchaeota archaeon]|nr:30S ribosomal protein S7 [Candidatus Lokiarchaeota archaeon]MBD3200426.1 30S ribosomal protein S7 [Candidatus Lokiarchaeota archaeon]